MGVIGAILGSAGAARQIGEAVGGVAEVFAGNRAQREAAASREAVAAVTEFGAEFARAPAGWFDGFVDGLNRLPRPLLTLGTLGLFVYAMAAPVGFALRMHGLDAVPEPLWWLLGAIVSFYFGSRELFYQRARSGLAAAAPAAQTRPPAAPVALAAPAAAVDPDRNAAIDEWRRLRT